MAWGKSYHSSQEDQKLKKKKNFALFGKIGCFSCTKTNGFSLMVDLIEIVSIKDYN